MKLLCCVIALLSLLAALAGCAKKPAPGERGPRALREFRFEVTEARLARGKYLATIAQCFDCHSPLDPVTNLPMRGKEGSGDILDSLGPEVAPNITPDSATGAGTWTDDMLVRAIREGVGHDGRKLLSSMRSEYFSVLTDEDVASIVVFLRSLPAVYHELPDGIGPEDEEDDGGEPRYIRPASTAGVYERGPVVVLADIVYF